MSYVATASFAKVARVAHIVGALKHWNFNTIAESGNQPTWVSISSSTSADARRAQLVDISPSRDGYLLLVWEPPRRYLHVYKRAAGDGAGEPARAKTLRRRQPLMITLSFSRNVRRLLNVFYTNKESSCLQYTRRSVREREQPRTNFAHAVPFGLSDVCSRVIIAVSMSLRCN